MMDSYRTSIFLIFLSLAALMQLTIAQWSTWQQCTVYRTKYRNCTPTGAVCPGSSSTSDSIVYTSCPVLTQSQVNSAINTRQAETATELTGIANSTAAAIAETEAIYAASIKTSSGFGYIAGIFIALLFIFPMLMDLQKFYAHYSDKKKLKEEEAKKAAAENHA